MMEAGLELDANGQNKCQALFCSKEGLPFISLLDRPHHGRGHSVICHAG